MVALVLLFPALLLRFFSRSLCLFAFELLIYVNAKCIVVSVVIRVLRVVACTTYPRFVPSLLSPILLHLLHEDNKYFYCYLIVYENIFTEIQNKY